MFKEEEKFAVKTKTSNVPSLKYLNSALSRESVSFMFSIPLTDLQMLILNNINNNKKLLLVKVHVFKVVNKMLDSIVILAFSVLIEQNRTS